jgi:ABC-type glycerol-3-phosphate transport system permease component
MARVSLQKMTPLKAQRTSTREPYKFRWIHLLLYFVLAVGAFVSVVPFLYMIATSLMTLGETINRQALPKVPQWANYLEAWREGQFSRYFFNTVIITMLTILGVLVSSILAGYAFANISFPGRDTIFMLLLATLMIPGTVTFIPNLLMVRGDIIPWGSWLNSLPALTVPFMAKAFAIFLLRQFFRTIPKELWDAARMDGAGHLRFLVSVVVPLGKAPILTVTLLTFIDSWNEFVWPLLVTTTATWRPLGVGLWTFVNEAGPQTHLLMAGAVITIIPVLIIYFMTQKHFTEGIASSGLKG